MTVIVGVIYQDGVVLISDRNNLMEGEGYSQITPKIICRDNLCLGVAGTGGYETDFIDIAVGKNWKEAFEAIKRKYAEIRWNLAVEEILKPIGCEKVEDIKMIGDAEVQSYYIQELRDFDPDIKLLMGVWDNGPHLCAVGNPGTGECFDEVGFSAIGSGEREATMLLNFLGYRRDFPEEKAIFFAYLAKKAAEISIGVDESSDILIIDKGGWRRVEEDKYAAQYNQFMKNVHNQIQIQTLRSKV